MKLFDFKHKEMQGRFVILRRMLCVPVKCVRVHASACVSSARHGRYELREVAVPAMRSRTPARFQGSSSSDPVNLLQQLRVNVLDAVNHSSVLDSV